MQLTLGLMRPLLPVLPVFRALKKLLQPQFLLLQTINMFRLLFFIAIATLIITPLYLAAVLLAIWYMFRFTGYELIILAILVDGYFGAFNELPVISLLTIVLVFLIDLLKPSLLMYTKNDEMVS